MAKSFVTFDAGSSSLKMAVFSVERNRIQLTDFDVAPISGAPEASVEEKNRILARQMKESISRKKVRAKDVLVSISGQSVFTRFVKLPAVEEAKVKQIVRYEAQQQVPFPIEDVEWDHHIISKTPTGEIDIVLVAVKNDVIASFIHECRKAGLEVTIVDVAPLCVYNCLRYVEQEFAECTAVIDFGARAANLIISEGDDLWARTIPIGGDNITDAIAKELNIDRADAEKLKQTAWVPATSGGEPQDATEQQRKAASVVGSFTNRMLAELSRSIGFYRSQPGHSAIKRILLCGGSSRLRNLKEFLSDKFNVDAGWLLPLARTPLGRSIDREQLNRFSDLLAGVVGLGLRGAETARIRVNLLPKTIARQKELSRKKAFAVAAGWLLVASLLLLGFEKKMAHGDNSKTFNSVIKSFSKTVGGIVPTGPTYKEHLEKLKDLLNRDSEMDSKISLIKGDIEKVEKKVDAIGEIQKARLDWARFIEDLKDTKTKVAGRGQRNYIWLTSLRLTTSTAVISEYMPEMEDMPRGMYLGQSYRTPAYARSTKTTTGRAKGPDTRPWVILTGYVKIPAEVSGKESEATRRVEEFMKALEAMGETFVCPKGHGYREDGATGVLIPLSADTGPARAYRFRWDEATKEVVVEGLVAVEASESENASDTTEEWKELARDKTRKKPDWIEDVRVKGDAAKFPCPIELSSSGDKGNPKDAARTAGYLDEVQVRWLRLQSEKVAMFTIIARFAGGFDYPKKSEML